MYISSIIDDTTFPTVPDNEKLREALSKKTTEELFVILQEKDPERASTIERDNPRRLIRALEIVEHLGKVPKQDITPPSDYAKSPYDMLQIGLSVPKEQLKKNIHARTIARMEKGFVEEVAELIEGGITLERMREFGLGYRCISEILAKTSNQEDTSCSILQNSKITSEEIKKMSECIENSEWRYAKRQMTWFKRDSRIEWFAPEEKERIFKRIVSFMV